MNISELVAKLEEIKAAHGDLRVVTPGYNETNLADIAVDLVGMFPDALPGGRGPRGGRHAASVFGYPHSETALCITHE